MLATRVSWPGGCSVIIDCLTDNNNRTITDVRNCFTKTNSKMGAQGSGVPTYLIICRLFFKRDSGDEVLEAMLTAEVDVTDVESENGQVTLFAHRQPSFSS